MFLEPQPVTRTEMPNRASGTASVRLRRCGRPTTSVMNISAAVMCPIGSAHVYQTISQAATALKLTKTGAHGRRALSRATPFAGVHRGRNIATPLIRIDKQCFRSASETVLLTPGAEARIASPHIDAEGADMRHMDRRFVGMSLGRPARTTPRIRVGHCTQVIETIGGRTRCRIISRKQYVIERCGPKRPLDPSTVFSRLPAPF